MERRELQKGIRDSWNAVIDLGLGATIGSAMPLPVDERFRDLLFSRGVQYNEVYLAGLEFQHYNILLSDIAFLQYTLVSENHVRYAYYPNPFLETVDAELNIGRFRELGAC